MSTQQIASTIANMTQRDIFEAQELSRKEVKAIKEEAKTMTATEARFLVDAYYIAQRERIRLDNQVRSMSADGEPNLVLSFLSTQAAHREDIMKKALDSFTKFHPVGIWMRSINGIGPVTAAALLAHIDINRAATAGAIWSFAGIDGTAKWEKGQKRPWNAALKTCCCVPGTIVTTMDGPRRIEDIRVGEYVLTHKGNWKPVIKTMVNEYEGNVNQMTAYGMGGMNGPIVTDGHPILSKKLRTCFYTQPDGRERFRFNPRIGVKKGTLDDAQWSELEHRVANGESGRSIALQLGCSESLVSTFKSGKRKRPVKVDPVNWIPAETADIGHLVLSPTPKFLDNDIWINFEDFPGLHNRAKALSFKINEDIARVIGMFIGDGHVEKVTTCWSFNITEERYAKFVVDTLDKEFGIRAVYKESPEKNMYVVYCGSKQLSQWLNVFVEKLAHFKRIPSMFFLATKPVIKGLLRGLFDSDGHYAPKNVSFSTVNQKLAQDTQQFLRMFKIQGNIYQGAHFNKFRDGPPKLCVHYTVSVNDIPRFYKEIIGEETNMRPVISVREWDDVGGWHAVTHNAKFDYKGYVYNLEVEEDHSYVANGIAVHNCFKIGESFVKVSGNPDAYYGQLYKRRKELETARNLNGEYKEQAAAELASKNYTKGTVTRNALEAGQLSAAHIHARARRYAVKIFLSHLHEVMYKTILGKNPPAPFAIAILNHAHRLEVPNPDMIQDFVEPVEIIEDHDVNPDLERE